MEGGTRAKSPIPTTREEPECTRVKTVLLPAYQSEPGRGPAVSVREEGPWNPALRDLFLSIGGGNCVVAAEGRWSKGTGIGEDGDRQKLGRFP